MKLFRGVNAGAGEVVEGCGGAIDGERGGGGVRGEVGGGAGIRRAERGGVVLLTHPKTFFLTPHYNPLTAKADVDKLKKYGWLESQRAMASFPLAFAVFGVRGNATLSFLRKLGRRTPSPRGFTEHVLTAIGMAIQRGNDQILIVATTTVH